MKIFIFLEEIKKKDKNKRKMGHNVHCSEDKRNLIKILRKWGKTLKEISNLMDCSINMVCNAIKKKIHPKHVVKRGKHLEEMTKILFFIPKEILLQRQ